MEPTERNPPGSYSRALMTKGASEEAIHRAVAAGIRSIHRSGGTLVDVGCGGGDLWPQVRGVFSRYIGLDLVRYEGFPNDGKLVLADFNAPALPLAPSIADFAVAVETIEHLENPRAFMRQLTALTKPGGTIIVTTPNQLSLLSKLTLLLKGEFTAFQEAQGLYPAHITALLEIDLVRIARECGLEEPAIRFSDSGRIPFTGFKWPSYLKGRLFSDNVILVARKPRVTGAAETGADSAASGQGGGA